MLSFLAGSLLPLSVLGQVNDFGVAIRYPKTTCPKGTFYIGTSFNANCCPDGLVGAPQGSAYCCPSEADCYAEVANHIQCANSSWTYFPSPGNNPIGFCCLPDWVGYVQLNSTGGQEGVACGTPGYIIQDSQSTVPSIGLAAATTVTFTPTPTTTLALTSATTTSQDTTATAIATSQSSSQSSSGLSTGAKAGIGVGAGLGVVLVVGGLGLWLILRRNNSKSSSGGDGTRNRAELPADAIRQGQVMHREKSGTSEMAAPVVPQELGVEHRTHELPTSPT